ncbi:MAG: hypothetical protein LBK72_08495 [Bifidobacteriaceae bacterium]|nr:hypothetical protein [Bifidobacteriaceae bacterium]
MDAPPFVLLYTPEFIRQLAAIGRDNPRKHGKVLKTLRLLRDPGPAYPSLQSHKYQSLTGPDGQEIWESYVENRTPAAWRVFWCYGPRAGDITMITVGPHPN